jgi:hypothetical protein
MDVVAILEHALEIINIGWQRCFDRARDASASIGAWFIGLYTNTLHMSISDDDGTFGWL